MLRGTNRSIIEINETENKYFEKVLLFVKPEFGTLPVERLKREANRMVGGISFSPMGLNRHISARKLAMRKKRKRIALVALGVLAIIILSIIKIF